ncbi:hypothetical protein Avbf_14152 [Armadillidium vulgare]|nr:hypothetical protein Avbf_14152 [Armadillidium vulgare]
MYMNTSKHNYNLILFSCNYNFYSYKSKVTLGLLIALPIVILSIIFFYNGNIAYGVLMISLPVLSLIVSTCCYMLDKRK